MRKESFKKRRKRIINAVKRDYSSGYTVLFNVSTDFIIQKLKKADNLNELLGILLSNGCAITYMYEDFSEEEINSFLEYMYERINNADELNRFYLKNDKSRALECLEFADNLKCSINRKSIKHIKFSESEMKGTSN